MAKFYIKFETMVEISQISPNSTIEDLVYFFFPSLFLLSEFKLDNEYFFH